MSLDARLRPRPLSPHLAIYRLTSTLAQYLAERGVKYDVVEHPFAVTASESAKASHISLHRLAEPVVRSREKTVSFSPYFQSSSANSASGSDPI
jgi:hypothetical protein